MEPENIQSWSIIYSPLSICMLVFSQKLSIKLFQFEAHNVLSLVTYYILGYAIFNQILLKKKSLIPILNMID